MKEPVVCIICLKELSCPSKTKAGGIINGHIRERHGEIYKSIQVRQEKRAKLMAEAEEIRHAVKAMFGYTLTDRHEGG